MGRLTLTPPNPKSRHRRAARQTKRKGARLHLCFAAARDRSPVSLEIRGRSLPGDEMVGPALEEKLAEPPSSLRSGRPRVRLFARRSVQESLLPLRNFVVWAFSRPALNKPLLRERKRFIHPLMSAAFESGRDKEAFPHFACRGRDELLLPPPPTSPPILMFFFVLFFSRALGEPGCGARAMRRRLCPLFRVAVVSGIHMVIRSRLREERKTP